MNTYFSLAALVIFIASHLWAYHLGKRSEKLIHEEEINKSAKNYAQGLKRWIEENDRVNNENRNLRQEIHKAFVRGADVMDLMRLLTQSSGTTAH